MNINFGLLPSLDAAPTNAGGKRLKGKDKGRAKKGAVAARALADLDRWLALGPAAAAAE